MGWELVDTKTGLTESQRQLLAVVLVQERRKAVTAGLVIGTICMLLGAALAWWFFNQSYTITN